MYTSLYKLFLVKNKSIEHNHFQISKIPKEFLDVQWLGFGTVTVEILGSVPGQRTKILQATQFSQKRA